MIESTWEQTKGMRKPLRVVAVHPSPDRYGSDLQLVETAKALVQSGMQLVVVLPHDGELVVEFSDIAEVRTELSFPVLRKSMVCFKGLLSLATTSLMTVPRGILLLKRERPDIVIVNTITIPIWILIAKLSGIRVICHVHEAEESGNTLLLRALVLPLSVANRVITNSNSATRSLSANSPSLVSKTTMIYNGVPVPKRASRSASWEDPRVDELHILYVGRISPRKGTDILLRAVPKILAGTTSRVQVTIVGDVFSGYEWYELELRQMLSEFGIGRTVSFLGYRKDPFTLAGPSTVFVVPSRVEPFGNVAAEAQLARVPVVASNVQGLAEIVRDQVSGLQFEADDSKGLASCVLALHEDRALRTELVDRAEILALSRFGVDRYNAEIVRLVRTVAMEARMHKDRHE